jgi:hypothetical protein
MVADYFEFTDSKIEKGQGILSDSMKVHVHNKNKEFFNLLEFEDDNSFLEPFLFSHYYGQIFNKKHNIEIEEICAGYIKSSKRKNLSIEVNVDSSGVVYLPNFGYITTEVKNSKLDISWDDSGESFKIFFNGSELGFNFLDTEKLSGSDIEIMLCVPKLAQEHLLKSNILIV